MRYSLSTILIVAVLGQVAFGQPPQAPPDDPRPRAPMSEVVRFAADATPTPYNEVVRVIGLLPKPEVGFVDFGCGSEARWCITAAERWGCRVTGIEIDPTRAALAKRRVEEAGLDHLITIIEGDAITTDVQADVGVAYLYSDVLGQLKPRLEKLRAFASYLHQPPGLAAVKNGESWIYTRPTTSAAQVKGAVWNGQVYSHPVCNNPACGMCNAIRAQLNASQSRPPWPPEASIANSMAARGHYETRVQCNGRRCQKVNVWVQD